MDFLLSEEQQMIVKTTRDFVVNELYPYEAEIEETGHLRPELRDEIKRKAIEAGLYAANMPAEAGGAGLDTLTWVLYEKELGRANYALHWNCVARPSNILMACVGEQREKYLFPAVAGKMVDCLAMTEPGVGSDVRGMKCFAKQDGDDFIVNGTKHFISHADEATFTILFAATGEEDTPRGKKKLITAFLVDKGTPGFAATTSLSKSGLRTIPMGGFELTDCAVPESSRLGAEGIGLSMFNHTLEWERSFILASHVGAMARQLDEAVAYAKTRQQFGRPIGAFQSVSNRLADMKVRLETARLLLYKLAWMKHEAQPAALESAIAKLHVSECFLDSSIDAVRTFGGKGYLAEAGVERDLRDALGGVIYAGTSDIQRNLIARLLGL